MMGRSMGLMREACANESGEGGLGGNREWGLYLGFICYIHRSQTML